jgi:peptidyl-prolyl cis-trans isomerase B (cyclophilin B)
MAHVLLTLENASTVELELYEALAPKTVANFLKLVSENFYHGLTFHRVIQGFMIQGGCPQGSGTGGPGYHIEGEFKSNGFDNPIKHERGVISMARSMSPNSAGSQFFIMHKDAHHLDGAYAAFGKVIKGIEVIDSIAAVQTGANDQPLQPVKIQSIEIL